MKVGEWDSLGPVRGHLQRQLGELGAVEEAAHVTVNPANGRMRILIAADLGLLEYTYAPSAPDAPWYLRGNLVRWPAVHGLRLQTDAQLASGDTAARQTWRFVADDPKIEVVADADADSRTIASLMDFARACLRRAG